MWSKGTDLRHKTGWFRGSGHSAATPVSTGGFGRCSERGPQTSLRTQEPVRTCGGGRGKGGRGACCGGRFAALRMRLELTLGVWATFQ